VILIQACWYVLSRTRKETSKCFCQNGLNFLRRFALLEKKLDDSSRLDFVEIARVPEILPSLFASWSGLRIISPPVFRGSLKMDPGNRALSRRILCDPCGLITETCLKELCIFSRTYTPPKYALERPKPRWFFLTKSYTHTWVVSFNIEPNTFHSKGTAVAQWLRCSAANWKVAVSIPDGVVGIFHWHNPSDRTRSLGSTQPLTEMSTRSISWREKRPVLKADNLTTMMCHSQLI